jgi:hypothetical protein
MGIFMQNIQNLSFINNTIYDMTTYSDGFGSGIESELNNTNVIFDGNIINYSDFLK